MRYEESFERKICFFRGGRRQEELLLLNNHTKLLPAQIICDILTLNQEFETKFQSILEDISSCSEKYWVECKTWDYTEQFMKPSQYVKDLKKLLKNRIERLENESERRVAWLVIVLPCIEAYFRSYDSAERLLPGKDYFAEHSPQNDGNGIDSINYNKLLHVSAPDTTLSYVWGAWLAYLSKETVMDFDKLCASVLFDENAGVAACAKKAFCEFKLTSFRLSHTLIECEPDSANELRRNIAGPRLYKREDDINLFPGSVKAPLKYGHVFIITSLSELVMAELDLLDKIDRVLIRCEKCGKLFVPYQATAKLCNFPNQAFGGKTCSRVESIEKYKKKRQQNNTAMDKLFEKKFKAYNKWANENLRFVSANIERLGLEQSERRARESMISKEITVGCDEWAGRARESLKRWKDNTISKEECESALTLPSVPERSGAMHDFRKEVREVPH